jgi:hypothetical protein
MAYCISEVRHAEFPNAGVVAVALVQLGLPLDELLATFRSYVCPVVPQTGRGYQMDVAYNLEHYLAVRLQCDGLRPTRSRYELTYSPNLKQYADFGLVHDASRRRVLFEIEFRPNYEKDLVKFQIGANRGLLAVAVMVVAIDRKSLNAAYTTMPEYAAIVRVLSELRPAYPLVVVGLRGAHGA